MERDWGHVLFLLGGFGTRLAKDLDLDDAHDSLKGLPKGLLPLGPEERPLLDHWLERLSGEYASDQLFYISNALYYPQFVTWLHPQHLDHPQHLAKNESLRNQDRLGSIGDLELAVFVKFPVLQSKPLLLIAGDTLFLNDFDLRAHFLVHTISSSLPPPVLVACYPCSDAQCSKTGILSLQDSPSWPKSVIQFYEKPLPSETDSRHACPCFYYIPTQALPLIQAFMTEKQRELTQVDAAGKWIAWLVQTQAYPVSAVPISGRLDIGGLDSYLEAHQYLSSSPSHSGEKS